MKRSGSSLIMIATLTTLLILTSLAVCINAVSNLNVTTEEKARIRLEYACEAGIKRAKAKIMESFNNSSLNILEPNVTFEGTYADDTGKTPEQKAYFDETFNIGNGSEPDNYTFKIKSDIDNKEITVKYAITESESWHKSQTFTTYTMNIEAIAYLQGYGWVGMDEEAYSRRTTLFMYNVFFQDDLEILPGPTFTLKGLIHTNKNMYLSANNSLNIYTDSLTAAGEIFRKRLDSDSYGGTVKITSGDASGTLTTMASGSSGNADDSRNSNWVDLASSKWGGTVKDKHLGATVQEAPKLESFTPGGYYDKLSNLKIEVLAKGRTHPVYQITCNGVTTTYDSSNSNNGLNNALKEDTFYDRREFTNKKVNTTAVDVQKLADLGFKPNNGLIYMTRDDAVPDSDNDDTQTDPNRVVSGFKLYNGSQLNAPTTFVSNLPTYIKGDFNLHTSSNPLTDKWQPCALISDAINLLSNSWEDSGSSQTQTASTTTYNLVFITGNLPTQTGQYNGGLENFPRFLESWSGKSANITGGFIQLFRSQYSTGKWGGSYYRPPIRNWQSESYFSDLRDLPPGFANLFPSTNVSIIYSNRQQISKDEAALLDN